MWKLDSFICEIIVLKISAWIFFFFFSNLSVTRRIQTQFNLLEEYISNSSNRLTLLDALLQRCSKVKTTSLRGLTIYFMYLPNFLKLIT